MKEKQFSAKNIKKKKRRGGIETVLLPPGAPINDEVKKKNIDLPGMGGVFNTVNLHLYHYAGNNPVWIFILQGIPLMNKIQFLLILCLLCLNGCHFFELFKDEYADWEALINASENKKGWFPSLFKGRQSFENKIFNIIIIYYIDNINVWGKFDYSSNILNDFPLQINPYINNFVMSDSQKRRMNKIGFDDSKIKSYFTEIQDDRVWYYFIDTDENIIYFCNFIH